MDSDGKVIKCSYFYYFIIFITKYSESLVCIFLKFQTYHKYHENLYAMSQAFLNLLLLEADKHVHAL